jgi:inorganic pyrophosphatase
MASSSAYTTSKKGNSGTLTYRTFIEKDGKPISPFHDIPLWANEEKTVLNMIVEIPRWTQAKYEVSQLRALPVDKRSIKPSAG